jgi:hypothetical protein
MHQTTAEPVWMRENLEMESQQSDRYEMLCCRVAGRNGF